MKYYGKCFLRIRTQGVLQQVRGSKADSAGSQAWNRVRDSHTVLIWKAWRSHWKQPRIDTVRGQERPLVKVQPQLQWRPQDTGNARTLSWPGRTMTDVQSNWPKALKQTACCGRQGSSSRAVHSLQASEFLMLDTELVKFANNTGCWILLWCYDF